VACCLSCLLVNGFNVMDDRIRRLCEAMGWEPYPTGSDPKFNWWVDPKTGKDYDKFDPFTNANDDYAVLEWMRGDYRWGPFKTALIELRKIEVSWHGSQFTWNYQVGDYARAALKVLDNE